MNPPLPYRIATLIFMEDTDGSQLLLHRRKEPNRNRWTPIGGKLDTTIGESPMECAVREVQEEAGVGIDASELHLFGYLAERAYESSAHWLIFLFHCHRKLEALPAEMSEGRFAFCTRKSMETLPMAPSDREILWPTYWKHRKGFTGIRIQYHPPGSAKPYSITVECEGN